MLIQVHFCLTQVKVDILYSGKELAVFCGRRLFRHRKNRKCPAMPLDVHIVQMYRCDTSNYGYTSYCSDTVYVNVHLLYACIYSFEPLLLMSVICMHIPMFECMYW